MQLLPFHDRAEVCAAAAVFSCVHIPSEKLFTVVYTSIAAGVGDLCSSMVHQLWGVMQLLPFRAEVQVLLPLTERSHLLVSVC